MPTYEYECNKCRRVFEVRQRISEPALTIHDGCGGEVHRLLSPAPFILKGEGWYVTDYPSEARKKAKEAEKPAAEKSASGSAKDGAAKGSSDKGSTEKSGTTTPSAPSSSSSSSSKSD